MLLKQERPIRDSGLEVSEMDTAFRTGLMVHDMKV